MRRYGRGPPRHRVRDAVGRAVWADVASALGAATQTGHPPRVVGRTHGRSPRRQTGPRPARDRGRRGADGAARAPRAARPAGARELSGPLALVMLRRSAVADPDARPPSAGAAARVFR